MSFIDKLHYWYPINKILGPKEFEISLASDSNHSFHHLILTGPNGSGKTTLLKELVKQVWEDLRHRKSQGGIIRLDWEPPRLSGQELPYRFKEGKFIAVYVEAMRNFQVQLPSGPQKLDLEPSPLGLKMSKHIVQFLVNKKSQQGFAMLEGQNEEVEKIKEWFNTLENNLRELLALPEMSLEFDSTGFNFNISHEDGRKYDFTSLADGHASALEIFSEILLRCDAMQKTEATLPQDLEGIILIDELETHLHLELQEKILPFLTNMFPKLQFIVATHSPAVIASVDNAVVFDLETKQARKSAEYRGVSYGALMTGHFGISSDFDLYTTNQLQKLNELYQKGEARTKEEEHTFKTLAQELSKTSHPLALKVWNLLELGEV